jgi:hypothetical protein
MEANSVMRALRVSRVRQRTEANEMIVVWRFSGIARTLAAGLCLAAAPSLAVAQSWSNRFAQPELYAVDADHTMPATDYVTQIAGEEYDIISVSDCSAGCGYDGCGCDEGYCDGEGCGCNSCCRPQVSCVAGTEITFLVPEIDDGVLDAEFDDNGDIDEVNNDELDLHDMTYAPRVWVGLQRCGWGAVMRFWHLDACDSERDPFEADGFGYDQNSDLEMQTIDLEATRDVRYCGSKFSATGGLRYASYDHSTVLNTIGESDDDDAIYATSAMFRQFNRGTGLTGSLSGTSPIRGTFVSWFYSARGSWLLFGHGDTAAESGVFLGADDAQGTAVNGASATTDDGFIIFETQLGLMAEHRLQCYPANAFVRMALEWQHWSGDENSSSASSFAGLGLPVTSVADVDASTAGMDMNLYGFAISTGLTY